MTNYILNIIAKREKPIFYKEEETQAMSDLSNKTKYDLEYAKKKLKRIPLDVQKEKYDEIKAAATAAGESVTVTSRKRLTIEWNVKLKMMNRCCRNGNTSIQCPSFFSSEIATVLPE